MSNADKKPRLSRTRVPPPPVSRRETQAAPVETAGYWTIDLTTRAVTWSPGLYALYGIDAATFTPHVATQLDIYGASAGVMIERFQNAVNSGDDFDFTVDIRRVSDKALRHIHITGGVDYDSYGQPSRLCAVVRDVTQDAARRATPAAAPQEIAGINAAKDDFLAHITNGLRAPLNDILSYARLLNAERLDNPDVASYAHNLLQSARVLQSLVEDTLEAPSPVPASRPVMRPAVSRRVLQPRPMQRVDDSRINREYLSALLRDMQQNLH